MKDIVLHFTVTQDGQKVYDPIVRYKRVVTIGRDQTNDVFLPDTKTEISMFHAIIIIEDSTEFYFQEIGANNISQVNGKKEMYRRIDEKDEITIGSFVISLRISKLGIVEKRKPIDIIEESIEIKETKVLSNMEDINLINAFNDDPALPFALYEITSQLNNYPSSNVAFRLLESMMKDKFKVKHLVIGFCENGENDFYELLQYPKDKMPISTALLSELFRKKSYVYIEKIKQLEEFRSSKSIRLSDLSNVLLYPILNEDRIIGFIFIDLPFEINQNINSILEIIRLLSTDLSNFIKRNIETRKQDQKLESHKSDLGKDLTFIGVSPFHREVMRLVKIYSKENYDLLITGETGTGKDIVARLIHSQSNRKHLPMQIADCGFHKGSLFRSEIFGHKRGAFTDAKENKRGKLELVGEGTLFLDEIGNIPEENQEELLRVLEDRVYNRVGDEITRQFKGRIIAATNKDLEEEIKKGNFRADLYERLSTLKLNIQSLNKRKADILILAGYFLYLSRRELNRTVMGFSKPFRKKLINHEWPRNIRELKNIIFRAVVESNSKLLDYISFTPRDCLDQIETLEQVERKHIVEVYERLNRNQSQAASVLGISRGKLIKKLKEYRII